MGIVSSPYTSIQGISFTEEIIRGNPDDESNVFRWSDVVLNLPGSPAYKPCDPWVFRACKAVPSGAIRIANDFKIYVDDVRTIGAMYAECRQASQRVASILSFLGIQDAPRKRRDPSQTPGPWAGSIVCTSQDAVFVTISKER
jgi:hypothetical protein